MDKSYFNYCILANKAAIAYQQVRYIDTPPRADADLEALLFLLVITPALLLKDGFVRCGSPQEKYFIYK